MPLESLLKLVETLRSRIDEHGGALRQSEALTRSALIDPLLRELGWDTENPSLVMPEYRLGRGYADYALLNDGKPMIMVEAKKLGTPLHDAASQGIGYCIEDGIAYFTVTDGRLWEIYETHKMAPVSEKMVVRFDITHSPPITCLQVLALWRPAVENDNVMAAETPLVGLDATERDAPEQIEDVSQELSAQSANNVIESAQQLQPLLSKTPAFANISNERDDSEWIPLTALNVKPGEVPGAILFPDKSLVGVGNWATVLAEITRWLANNNILNETHCPVQFGDLYLLAAEPVHPNGEEFSRSRPVSNLYVYTGGRNRYHVRNARRIVQHVGQDPAEFKVRLSS